MARAKKTEKTPEQTFEEQLNQIDLDREVQSTQLEEGLITLRNVAVSKMGKQFQLSFLGEKGSYYSRLLDSGKSGKNRKGDNSYWILFSYFRSDGKTIKIPDESWIMFRHAEKDIYRCFHPQDSGCDKLRALGFEEAPFSIKSWMNICVGRNLLELFRGFGRNISYSPVEVIFDSKNRRMVIPVDSTKVGLDMDLED